VGPSGPTFARIRTRLHLTFAQSFYIIPYANIRSALHACGIAWHTNNYTFACTLGSPVTGPRRFAPPARTIDFVLIEKRPQASMAPATPPAQTGHIVLEKTFDASSSTAVFTPLTATAPRHPQPRRRTTFSSVTPSPIPHSAGDLDAAIVPEKNSWLTAAPISLPHSPADVPQPWRPRCRACSRS
jgi:hypothetical protein